MGMISVFVGAMAGGCFGVIMMCLLIAGRRVDECHRIYESEGRYLPGPVLPQAGETDICFVDPDGACLFTIPDGACLELVYGNGEKGMGICHYLDPYHARIDGVEWELSEFARQMEKRGIQFFPIEPREMERR